MSESTRQKPTSSIVVQKYGGSSVATTERIMGVAKRIKATADAGHRVCVVVSAIANTTDELLAKAHEISAAPPRRELDMLLSCGERASMALLSMAVSELGLEAISFTGSQCGIMTNDRHWGAQIVDVRPFRVSDELERGKVVIVAGFQGVSYKREITTLGRGGSDTTAVALAGALGAEYCEICSDVDGVYTADPRVVDAATLLDAISHDEMLELASHGARVLHPAAIEFAKRLGIALWARGTTSDARGTRVEGPPSSDGQAVGVSAQSLYRILVESDADADTCLSVLAEAGVCLSGSAFAAHGWTLLVSTDEAPDWSAVRTSLEQSLGKRVTIDDVAAVSVVGGGIGGRADAISRVRRLAGDADIPLLALEGSPLRLTVQCSGDSAAELTARLHHEFVER